MRKSILRLVSALAAMGGMVIVGGGRAAASTYQLLHSFAGGSDGAIPEGPLIDVKGTLYGTTSSGGGTGCGGTGCGTVFKITPQGAESVVYAFQGGADGQNPSGGLISVGGALYGLTPGGGTGCGCGTVFKVTEKGVESVLYAFAGGSDGTTPYGGLVNIGGTFYGATYNGGGTGCTRDGQGCGTLFQVTSQGAEQVIYRFLGGSDGAYPYSNLLNVGGTLYGTTTAGGGSHNCDPYSDGCGTVFTASVKGTVSVQYAFKGDAGQVVDGALPYGGLMGDKSGNLYGTTSRGGGASTICDQQCGTVFKLTPKGTETLLSQFDAANVGGIPFAGLVSVKGLFYGVAYIGGGSGEGCDNGGAAGCGAIFALTKTGPATSVHEFGANDGTKPFGGLINVKGTLYGTTTSGGSGTSNNGTVFAFTP